MLFIIQNPMILNRNSDFFYKTNRLESIRIANRNALPPQCASASNRDGLRNYCFIIVFWFPYAVVAWKTTSPNGTEKIMWSFTAFQWASLQLRRADCGDGWSAVNRKDWRPNERTRRRRRSGIPSAGRYASMPASNNNVNYTVYTLIWNAHFISGSCTF